MWITVAYLFSLTTCYFTYGLHKWIVCFNVIIYFPQHAPIVKHVARNTVLIRTQFRKNLASNENCEDLIREQWTNKTLWNMNEWKRVLRSSQVVIESSSVSEDRRQGGTVLRPPSLWRSLCCSEHHALRGTNLLGDTHAADSLHQVVKKLKDSGYSWQMGTTEAKAREAPGHPPARLLCQQEHPATNKGLLCPRHCFAGALWFPILDRAKLGAHSTGRNMYRFHLS